ncbi:MAG: GNAT family N-acetyltransferase [Candidatus Hydrogenedentota bacterium]
MRIELFDINKYEKKWDEFLLNNSDSTVFHTSIWLKLMSEFYNFKLYPLSAIDQGNIIGILPFFQVKALQLNHLVSLPLRDKGGCVVSRDDNNTRARLIESMIQFGRTLDCNYIQVKTSDSEEKNVLEQMGFSVREEWILSSIKLEPDFNITRNNFIDKRLNWSINKAITSNLQFEDAVSDIAVSEFYRIFLNKRKSLGVPPYAKKYFDLLYSLFAPSGMAKIFIVRKGSESLSSTFLLFHNRKVYDIFSASLEKGYEYRANDFLIWHMIKWLCEHGYDEIDLGADSPYQETLIKYKRKWGVNEKNQYFLYYFIKNKKIFIRDSDHPGYRWIRKIWRWMPDFMFENLGSMLIKYLA